MSNEIKIVQPNVQRAPARARGPLSSEDYNNFQDQVFDDINNLSEAVNILSSRLVKALNNTESDTQSIRSRIDNLEEKLIYREFVAGKTGSRVDKYIDFHDSSSITFPSNLNISRRAEIKSQFGEIYLPANSVENKFYNFSLRTNQIVLAPDFSVSVTNTFDKLDGNGTRNYENGGDINPGTPEYAFNGINELAWLRSVSFPLESTVEEVECQLTITVPTTVSSQANLLEIVPYPNGSVDLLELSTASDLSSSFISIENFEEINNINATRYHFTPRDVEQIRIRLRCRNWRDINGKKVFQYGLQELGLKLVDYVKTLTSDVNFGDVVTSVIKIDAPRSHVFNSLFRIDPNPNFFLEDSGNRHVRLRLSRTQDLSGVLWDSNVHTLPQHSVNNGFSLGGAATIYAIYTLLFVKNSSGYSSPFPVGTTPTVKGLGLYFSATQSDNN